MQYLAQFAFPIRLGSHICLDFINTAEFRGREDAQEFLHTYLHLLAWCWRAEIIPESLADQLLTAARANPTAADAVFQQAVTLREGLFRLFVSVASGSSPAPADLALLNATLGNRVIQTDGETFSWGWQSSGSALEIGLWTLAQAAAELLTSDDLGRLRQCPNCGWLFLDTSRNHSRRWCSMDFCGSKMKSRRQYARKTAQKLGDE